MAGGWPSEFLFASCQCGAEATLKQELARGSLKLRLAFSRPGFVTFKLAGSSVPPEQLQLVSTFARSWGFCLGRVQGTLLDGLAEQVWSWPAVDAFLKSEQIADLHVWQRDSRVQDEKALGPGLTCLALEAEQALRRAAPSSLLRNMPCGPRQPSRRNRWVLDVVLVERGEWWLGCHQTRRRHDCWPGGVVPLELPTHAVSRAYLKMQEALQWSALPLARGDLCADFGCAPGGTAQVLLEAGLRVIGVDPAEVDSRVARHPNFQHVRRRTRDLPSKRLRGVRWLAADMNVTPSYTLDAVEEVVSRQTSSLRGLILTLKFTDWKLAESLPEYVDRVRGWGFRDVRTRQLASHRQEICLVALRSRTQRRVVRRGRRHRRDGPHSTPTSPKKNVS
ncbi:MAG: hypothetical protein MK171_10890 [Pirellulales bacterium]|nr:hypothetical protein [Pirellulales bacterium]